MNPALVILAAGASERLGECKALVDLGFMTPLSNLCRAGSCLAPHRPLVVTGAHDRLIAQRAPAGVELCYNPEWRLGRTGGLQRAVAMRPNQDLCIAPVDTPRVPRAVFEALLDQWARVDRPALGWLAPRYLPEGSGAPSSPDSGRFGHPIVVGRGLLGRLGELAPDAPLRELRAWADPLLSVPVDSPTVLEDLDTPEDLSRIRALRASELGSPGERP